MRHCLAIVLLPVALWAHHSIAPYDMEQEAEVAGVVASVSWVNPHAYIYLDVDAKRWILELESPNLLRHQGWAKDSAKPGETFSCRGARAKDPSLFRMKCFEATLADGRMLRAQ